jgi:hypothetical protein
MQGILTTTAVKKEPHGIFIAPENRKDILFNMVRGNWPNPKVTDYLASLKKDGDDPGAKWRSMKSN